MAEHEGSRRKKDGLRIRVPSNTVGMEKRISFIGGSSGCGSMSPRAFASAVSPRNGGAMSPVHGTSFSPRSTLLQSSSQPAASSPRAQLLSHVPNVVGHTQSATYSLFSPRTYGIGPLSPRKTSNTPMMVSPRNPPGLLFSPTAVGADPWIDSLAEGPQSNKQMEVSTANSLKFLEELDDKGVRSNGSVKKRLSMDVKAIEQLLEGQESGELSRRLTEPPMAGTKLEPTEQKVLVDVKSFSRNEESSEHGKAEEATLKRELRRRALRAKKLASGLAPLVKKPSMKRTPGGSTSEKDTVDIEKKNRRLLRNREAAMRSRKMAKEKMSRVQEELEEVYDQVEHLQETNHLLKQHLQMLTTSALTEKSNLTKEDRARLLRQIESVLQVGDGRKRSGPSSSI